MANYEDYLPNGENDPNANPDGIQAEIDAAAQDQAARLDPSTPQHDWEDRFKNLEVLNSQQAQTLGDYRKIIDDFIVSPTSEVAKPSQQESEPITYDDLYANPDETIQAAINSALASHPAIQEAQNIKKTFEKVERTRSVNEFKERHPDFEDIKETPEFASWVRENDTRIALATAADTYDMNSADALFSLYKAETGLAQKISERQEAEAIQAASLEDSSNVIVDTQPKYSRSEFVETKMRAEQGDAKAERWVHRNVAAYRNALASGNVRD